MSVQDNVQARKDATEIVEMIGTQSAAFWALLATMADAKLPRAPQTVEHNPPMTEQEAIRFEADEIPFGKHKGTQVGEVPVDYLLWMTEGNEFDKALRRYVRSKRFWARQK